MCLPSDALLQHLPSYLGFSYLGRGVSLNGYSSKAQPLLLTLDEGYLLTAARTGVMEPKFFPINSYLSPYPIPPQILLNYFYVSKYLPHPHPFLHLPLFLLMWI